MQRYRRLVYRIAYGFTRDADDALEIVQDTFLKVHERLGRLEGRGRRQELDRAHRRERGA